jgi:MoaA/NifB/PqqE/SkfB family radical SAM enzyme
MTIDVSSDVPRRLYVELTMRCNMDCGMCVRHVWEDPLREMRPELFYRLMDQLRETPTVETIQFGGFGEPTIHPHFFDFLDRVKSQGLRAELITNGLTLNEQFADRILKAGLDRLIVSFDAVEDDPTFHPLFGGSIERNLRSLAYQKKIRGLKHPETLVEFVASRKNIDRLPLVNRMAKDLGYSGIIVSNLIPYTREMADDILYSRWTTAQRATDPSPWRPVINLPKLDPRSPASEVVEYLQVMGARLSILGQEMTGQGMHCRFVHEGCAAITPSGDVAPCLSLLHTHSYYYRDAPRRVQSHWVGNIAERSFAEIWNDEEYAAFRDRVRRFEFSPCIDCGGCDFRETNDDDCYDSGFPSCGECLWAAGIVQCP